MQQQTPPEQFDLAAIVADLNNLLRLKTTVIGIKMFARVEEMEAIPKIRRPSAVHTTDQIVSMASRLGWTVGITGDDLVGAQCRAVIGLAPQDVFRLAADPIPDRIERRELAPLRIDLMNCHSWSRNSVVLECVIAR